MTKTITARANLTLLVEGAGYDPEGKGEFVVPSGEVSYDVAVDYRAKTVISSVDAIPISTQSYEFLVHPQRGSLRDADETTRKELGAISGGLVSAARCVLSILKYHLGNIAISESLFSVKGKEWRDGEHDWAEFPMEGSASLDGISLVTVSDLTTPQIQNQINSDIQPLIAWRHLHRARNETQPHHKWIDATIAAELAIKEILIRAKPEIEAILLEAPSPPISKLYGSVMEAYLGERSPYGKTIRNGMEVRNKLVHRPIATIIDLQQSINYTREVEAAIFHALRLLYPEDKLLESCQRSVSHF